MSEIENLPPVEIPFASLSDQALAGLIGEFILREGTDYGNVEIAYDTKVQQIRKSIENEDVKVVFDPNTDSVTLMTRNEYRKVSISY